MTRPSALLSALLFLALIPSAFAANGLTALGPVPLPEADGDSSPQQFITTSNGLGYFVAYDTSGSKLWRSDGSDAGTYSLQLVNGSVDQGISLFAGVDGYLYYVTGSTSLVVGATDGTQQGTVEVTDGIGAAHFANCGNAVYGLFDGTLCKMQNGKVISSISCPSCDNLFSANGKLYISASDGLHESNGSSLGQLITSIKPTGVFALNASCLGLLDGTLKILRLSDSSIKDSGIAPSCVASCANRLYFSSGAGLFIAEDDGSTITFTTYTNFANGYGYPRIMANGDALFCLHDNGVNGTDLWKVQPDKQMILLKTLRAGAAGTYGMALALFGSGVACLVEDASCSQELWQSDGSTAGTQLVRAIGVPPVRPGIASTGNRLFFGGEDSHGGGTLDQRWNNRRNAYCKEY